MATTENGWLALSNSTLQSKHLTIIEPVPGRKFRVRKEAAPLFNYFISRFHDLVEPIDRGVLDDWSFNYRPVRGGSRKLSNHASGTAVDLNSTEHPYRRPNTFEPHEVRLIEKILDECQGLLRWGGNYSRVKDDMHFEVHPNATMEQIKEFSGMPTIHRVGSRVVKNGDAGLDVAYIQTQLGFSPDDIDGDFGPKTEQAVKHFQEARGLEVDGKVGPATFASLRDPVETDLSTADLIDMLTLRIPDGTVEGLKLEHVIPAKVILSELKRVLP